MTFDNCLFENRKKRKKEIIKINSTNFNIMFCYLCTLGDVN